MTLDDLMYRQGLLTGSRILITGGGTGLGRVMAEAFLLLGATVFICGRRQEVLDATAEELGGTTGGTIVPIVCDIREPESVAALLDQIWAVGGALTGLVNNAAGTFISRTETLSIRGFDAVSNIVARGTFLVTLECGKRWIAGGNEASVVSLLTTWVHGGAPYATATGMAKAAVHAMTQSLAVEWGPKGIRFNAIAPGIFPTPGMNGQLDPAQNNFNPADRNPLRRSGRMEELANLAVLLMARGAGYVNGQLIAIDGAEYQATGGTFAHMSSLSDSDWDRIVRPSKRKTTPRPSP